MKIILKNIFGISLLILFAGKSLIAQNILTLEQAKKLGLDRNNKLKIAQQNIEVAKAGEEEAKAPMYPSFSGSVTGFYFGNPLDVVLPGFGVGGTVGLNQSIYSGGKIKQGRAIAQKELDIQQFQKVLTRSEVLLDVEKSYWGIAEASEQVILAGKYISLLEAFLYDLNNSYNVGIIYKNDVLRVQVQLNDAELNLTKSKDNLILAKLGLTQMIGLNDSIPFTISDSIRRNFSTGEQNFADAVNNRPEISVLTNVLAQQQLQIKMFQSDAIPTIGFSVSGLAAAGKKGINFSDPNSNFLGSYYGFLSINIPIWDGGAIRQRVKAQKFRVASQEIQLEETKQLLALEVQQAFLHLNESSKRIELSAVSLQQAEENLRLTTDRFKAGTILSKDVLEAQNLWEQVSGNLIDAKVQYKINEAIFKKAIGTLN
jgi:outer membrane protein TolC